MPKPHIVLIVGTRPEAIKVAPIALELRRYSDRLDTTLLSTGQHQEMLYQALAAFGLKPDKDLAIMQHGQTLAEVTSRALSGIDEALSALEPSMVIAQGDTTTTFASSLAAFYRRIPFAHVEAGLRTDTIDNPFPEEFNRRAAGLISKMHLAPTRWAFDNLLKEGKDPATISITGNTGIDAVRLAAEVSPDEWFPEHAGRVVLLTTHRRENWGEPQVAIARAAKRLVEEFEDVLLVVPMHKNPSVRETLESVLADQTRIRLVEPPDYAPFVKLMQRSALILSDSGGVQEEAPAFGIPVLVLRTTTERPEGVEAGTAKLVGTDEEEIYRNARILLGNSAAYEAMAKAVSPYGDGKASSRIRYIIAKELGVDTPQEPMWE